MVCGVTDSSDSPLTSAFVNARFLHNHRDVVAWVFRAIGATRHDGIMRLTEASHRFGLVIERPDFDGANVRAAQCRRCEGKRRKSTNRVVG
jgi:hypothetical protein